MGNTQKIIIIRIAKHFLWFFQERAWQFHRFFFFFILFKVDRIFSVSPFRSSSCAVLYNIQPAFATWKAGILPVILIHSIKIKKIINEDKILNDTKYVGRFYFKYDKIIMKNYKIIIFLHFWLNTNVLGTCSKLILSVSSYD